MLLRTFGLTLFAAATLGCTPEGQEMVPRDKIISVLADDPDMEQAKAIARARLPEFWDVADNPQNGESDFNLKVKVSDRYGTEFFWVNRLSRHDGRIYGTINNHPQTVKSVKLGEQIEIRDDQIADWLYMRNGKMHGNFTKRVLLKQMPKEEADAARAIMADP